MASSLWLDCMSRINNQSEALPTSLPGLFLSKFQGKFWKRGWGTKQIRRAILSVWNFSGGISVVLRTEKTARAQSKKINLTLEAIPDSFDTFSVTYKWYKIHPAAIKTADNTYANRKQCTRCPMLIDSWVNKYLWGLLTTWTGTWTSLCRFL